MEFKEIHEAKVGKCTHAHTHKRRAFNRGVRGHYSVQRIIQAKELQVRQYNHKHNYEDMVEILFLFSTGAKKQQECDRLARHCKQKHRFSLWLVLQHEPTKNQIK